MAKSQKNRPGNAVERAVKIVGGPTPASWLCRVSYAAIYEWRKRGVVPDTIAAVKLAQETFRRGEPISVEALAGMPALGPESGPVDPVAINRVGTAVSVRGKRQPDAPAGSPVSASSRQPKRAGRKSARFSTTPLPLKVAA